MTEKITVAEAADRLRHKSRDHSWDSRDHSWEGLAEALAGYEIVATPEPEPKLRVDHGWRLENVLPSTTTTASLIRDATYPVATFRPELAITAAQHLAALYGDPDRFRVAGEAAGFDTTVLVGDAGACGSVEVGVALSPACTIISYQGTVDRPDWRANLRSAWRLPWRPYLPQGCRVGWGWRQQAAAVIDELVRMLERDARWHAPLLVTGHSLGGALASLAVPALTRRGWPPAAAITFGSPRVGNGRWARWYTETFDRGMLVAGASSVTPSWAVVTAQRGVLDPVTRVPPRRWGARHVGRRVVLAQRMSGGGYEARLGLNAWRSRQARHPVGDLPAWRILSRAVAGVGGHPIGRYLAALRSVEKS